MSMHRLSGCPSCAEPLEEGDRFCGVCGYALSAPPAPPDPTPTLPDPAGAAFGAPPAPPGARAADGEPARAEGGSTHGYGSPAGPAHAPPRPAAAPGTRAGGDAPARAGGGQGAPAGGAPVRQGGPGFGSAAGVPAPGWEGTPVAPGSAVLTAPWDTAEPEPETPARPAGPAPEAAYGERNPHEGAYSTRPYGRPEPQVDPYPANQPEPGGSSPDGPYNSTPHEGSYHGTPQGEPHAGPFTGPPQGDPHESPHTGAPQGEPHTGPLDGVPQGDPRVAEGGRSCVACRSGSVDSDGYCEHCGHAQPRERDHLEEELCSVAAVSDRGLRHHRNEDSFAVAATALPDGSAATVAIVCDGVSSASRPDDASAAAAGAASEVLLDALPRGAHPAEAMHEAILAAGAAVSALAPQPPGAQNAPACTLVGAVVSSGLLTVGWVGDSRAYWVPDDRAALPRRLTEDDSWAAQMVAAGLMGEAEAYADIRAHAITGWLGADAYDLDPHTASFRPDHPGVVVVCTDGLWNYAESATDLARLLPADAAERPLHCAQVLVGHALDGGGHDNITVAVVPFAATPPEAEAEAEAEAARGTGPEAGSETAPEEEAAPEEAGAGAPPERPHPPA
ncbi:protein phosphatase 2C domain-containing protein [Streptomyces sp. NPDC005180]|uniref:protein phosphatase 2C domain-containing protein n=1 Tax=Streptomyces sp. NPDC005180 TaxID=3156868 RepID=UPI0033BE9F70